MITINTLGLSLFFIFLLFAASIGIWALLSGRFYEAPSRNRAENVRSVQKKIKSRFKQIEKKQEILQEKVSKLSEEITPQLPQREYWGAHSVKDEEAFRALTLDELLKRSEQLAVSLGDLTVDVKNKKSVWYNVPLISPIPSESDMFLKNLYGMIEDPFTKDMKMHHGVDFSAVEGTPVVASGNGKIAKVENKTFWGRRITIRHDYGYTSTYAHLGSVGVQKGQIVMKGDTIGTVGKTGWSTSPLVHFEVRKEGESFDPKVLLGPSVHR